MNKLCNIINDNRKFKHDINGMCGQLLQDPNNTLLIYNIYVYIYYDSLTTFLLTIIHLD
jgi:hypothetical protein